MKESFSKRRFYLNKKEKINSAEQNFTKEKDTFLKYEYKNKGKETNLEKNVNRLNKERIQIKNEFEKQKSVKNFILFSNEKEPKNDQKDINKNKKYFQFSRPNKILFTPNDYINASNKIYNNFQKNQYNKNFSRNNYNKSFEINKTTFKKEQTEDYNKNIIIDNRKYEKDNKIYNIFASFKIINNPKIEREKEKSPTKEKKSKYLYSFYSYRYKKKEIIKIQSIWRGYCFRKKNIGKIKNCILSISLIKIIMKIYKNRKINLYQKFIKILKNNKNKKYKFGTIRSITLKEKYAGFTKKNFFTGNNVFDNKKNINDNSLKNKKDSKNNIIFSKISELNQKKDNENNIQNKYNGKRKNMNDLDDIFNSPLKIIYVPKKISNKNRYYFMKRITKIKKLKLEEFMKFIRKKFLSLYFAILKNQYKYNSNFFKIKKLISTIDSIIKNYLRQNLKVYREKIIDKKVKEEIIKKNSLSQLNEYKNKHIKLIKETKFLKENIIEKKPKIKLKINKIKNQKVKFLEKNLANDIIIENICESENEEESQPINYKNKKDNFSLLNKIVSKKMNDNLSILNKYFDQWKQFSDSFNDNGRPILNIRNMHSPDLEIRGNKSKKRYIKIKYSRALTSKTNLSSIVTEGRSNSSTSSFYVKKMKVRNIMINTATKLPIYKYKEESNCKKNIKLSYIIQKIDNKANIIKCFKSWKIVK